MIDMQAACSLHTRVDAGLSGADTLHAACMQAAYAGMSGVINAGHSGVDDGLSGVDVHMHPAASCQSI